MGAFRQAFPALPLGGRVLSTREFDLISNRRFNMFEGFFGSLMEDTAEHDAKMDALLQLQHARANAKRADWARPTKFDGFWKHPKANARFNDNKRWHAEKTPQYQLPD